MSQLKQIKDPVQVQKIAASLFCKLPVFLKSKRGKLSVKVNGFRNNLLELIHGQSVAKFRILMLTHKDHSMFLECQVEGATPEGSELVRPLRLHVKKREDGEKPNALPKMDGKMVWVSDCLPIASFPQKLAAMNARRDKLFEVYRRELLKKFTDSNIETRRTFRMDLRMRAMNRHKKSIYAPDRKSDEKWDDNRFVTFEDYGKLTRYNDIAENYMGEICEPFMYRNLYLYGYVQVFTERELTMKDYELVCRFARELEQKLEQGQFLPMNPEKSPVIVISFQGAGFMHPHNPSIIRAFLPGEEVIFDIHFPNSNSTTLIAEIQTAKPLEKAHQIGVKFNPMNDEQMRMIENYLSKIGGIEEN